MAVDLVKLVARLELESAKYMRGMEAAQKKLARYEKASFSAAGATRAFNKALGALAVGATISKLATLAKGTLDYADSVAEAADALGVSTKFYQENAFAAAQAGIDQEKYTASFSKFVQLAQDAANGDKGPQAIFDKLGVSVRENIDDVGKLFDLVVERLDSIPNEAQKLTTIGDLFGTKVAAKWAATLAGGKAGLDEMRKSANELGLVISDANIRTLGQLGDQIDAVGVKFKVAFATGLAEGLIGKSGELKDIWTDPQFKKSIDEVARSIELVAIAIGKIPSLVGKIAELREFFTLSATTATGAYLGSSFGPVGTLAGGVAGMGVGAFTNAGWAADDERAAAAEKAAEQMKALSDSRAAMSVDTGMSMMPEEGMSIASERELELINATIAAQDKLATSTKNTATTSTQQAAATHEAADAFDYQNEIIQAGIDYQQRLDDTFAQYADILLDVKPELLAYSQIIDDLSELLDAGSISQEQFNAALGRAKNQIDGIKTAADFYEDNIDRIKGASEGLFENLITDGKNWKDHLLDFFAQIASSYAKMAAEMAAQQIFGGEGGAGGIDWAKIGIGLLSSLAGSGAASWSGGGGGYLNGAGTDSHSVIMTNADGGVIPAGGWSIVGERGPELVMSRAASRVFSNEDSADMMSRGGNTVIQNWQVKDYNSFQASKRQIQRTTKQGLGLR